MRTRSTNSRFVAIVISCALGLTACSHAQKQGSESSRPNLDGLKEAKVTGPVLLRLKADMGRTEKVSYTHRAGTKAYEDSALRMEKQDALDFTSQAETLKVGPPDAKSISVFTQALTIIKKDGNADMHDFAMPDLDERLEVTANSLGQISKAGDYPSNSVFFVSPISLPENAVSVGDTWTMDATWLSLEEMIPYELQMVSILKGFWTCGTDTCAEIEINGDVSFQGQLNAALNFKSHWKGRIFFALNAGTVLWSRTDSEERLVADRIRRDVDSCLEAVLLEPKEFALQNLKGARCQAPSKSATENAH